jgi:hypothetical protein
MLSGPGVRRVDYVRYPKDERANVTGVVEEGANSHGKAASPASEDDRPTKQRGKPAPHEKNVRESSQPTGVAMARLLRQEAPRREILDEEPERRAGIFSRLLIVEKGDPRTVVPSELECMHLGCLMETAPMILEDREARRVDVFGTGLIPRFHGPKLMQLATGEYLLEENERPKGKCE